MLFVEGRTTIANFDICTVKNIAGDDLYDKCGCLVTYGSERKKKFIAIKSAVIVQTIVVVVIVSARAHVILPK